ncbi:hypothetical protein [Silvimonas iriomotensis]|uniref:hypothetical protein n=1 Tax=Silvimonas iriomotensis TaxID=449662 RepID=UPI00166C65A5|nr:hypothetical protein [Silvimonas iriomotensis]
MQHTEIKKRFYLNAPGASAASSHGAHQRSALAAGAAQLQNPANIKGLPFIQISTGKIQLRQLREDQPCRPKDISI